MPQTLKKVGPYLLWRFLISSSHGSRPSLPGSVILTVNIWWPVPFYRHTLYGLSASQETLVICFCPNQRTRLPEKIETKSLQGKWSIPQNMLWKRQAISKTYVLLPTKSPLPCPKSILMSGAEAFKSIRKASLMSGYLGPNIPANVNKSVLI